MKSFSLLLLVAILVGGCAPACKNIKADEEYQVTFLDKMKILGGLFVAYLEDTDYEPREQRRYIIYDRWNNYLPIYDVVEVAPNPARWREKERGQRTENSWQPAAGRKRLETKNQGQRSEENGQMCRRWK
jgi:hypothetical protein